jgi:hypothetical protein
MHIFYVVTHASAYKTVDVSYNTVDSRVFGKEFKSCLLEEFSVGCDFIRHNLDLVQGIFLKFHSLIKY